MNFCIFTKYFTVVMVASTILACKPISNTNHTGFILGSESNIETLKKDTANEDVQRFVQSTVLISTQLKEKSRKFCSGGLITDPADKDKNKIVTNFHCFAKTNGKEITDELLEEACVNTTVYFGFTAETAKDAYGIKCEKDSLIGDFDGDLAAFSLEEEPKENIKPFQLWDEPTIPNDRDAVIIHYPSDTDNYVYLMKEKTTLPVASVTERNCKTKSEFDPDEWSLDHALAFSFKHTCDLIHGSSGSPLIDTKTGKILGINWGGIEIKYGEKTDVNNAAIRSDYVRSFMLGETKDYKLKLKDRQGSASIEAEETKTESKFDKFKREKLDPISRKTKKIFCGITPGNVNNQTTLLLKILLFVPALFSLITTISSWIVRRRP